MMSLRTHTMTDVQSNSRLATPDDTAYVAGLSLIALTELCEREIDVFRREGSSNEGFAMELFRRAVLGTDKVTRDDAWAVILHLFSPLVLSWINRIPSADYLLRDEGSELALLNAVFSKAALSFARTPFKITHFSTLGAILEYIRRVSTSTVADAVRSARSRLTLVDISEAEELSVEDSTEMLSMQELKQMFWRIIEEETYDVELLYLQLAFIQGMKPAEIVALHPEVFMVVQNVYRIRRNVISRLARSRRVKRLKTLQEETLMIG